MMRGVILIFLLVLFCWQIVQAPWFFSLDKVEVQGNETMSAKQVEELAGVWRGEHLLRIDLGKTADRLLSSPQITSATLRRLWPNKLLILITENIGFAVVPYHDGFVEIDRLGRVISIVHDFSRVNLPIITGASIVDAVLGRELEGSNIAAARLVAVNMPSSVRPSISEINVALSGDISLITVNGVQIRLGNVLHSHLRLALLPAVLYAYEERGMSRSTIAYIDMTGEVPVYKGR
ncbi:MAG: Cell division protein FtsQ [Firmicutes bacterium]|nr:Cell division protein FtsQ [Bacillota bacterium]